MATVFDAGSAALDDAYIKRLLNDESFWAFAAFEGPEVVAGLTAHTLAMTRSPSAEVFLYDLAVKPDHQRRGIGRALVLALRAAAADAGIANVFVPADADDERACAFYAALRGEPAPVTIFTWDTRHASA